MFSHLKHEAFFIFNNVENKDLGYNNCTLKQLEQSNNEIISSSYFFSFSSLDPHH